LLLAGPLRRRLHRLGLTRGGVRLLFALAVALLTLLSLTSLVLARLARLFAAVLQLVAALRPTLRLITGAGITFSARSASTLVFQDALDGLAIIRAVGGDCRIGSLLALVAFLPLPLLAWARLLAISLLASALLAALALLLAGILLTLLLAHSIALLLLTVAPLAGLIALLATLLSA
jgi:hypothetical protein